MITKKTNGQIFNDLLNGNANNLNVTSSLVVLSKRIRQSRYREQSSGTIQYLRTGSDVQTDVQQKVKTTPCESAISKIKPRGLISQGSIKRKIDSEVSQRLKETAQSIRSKMNVQYRFLKAQTKRIEKINSNTHVQIKNDLLKSQIQFPNMAWITEEKPLTYIENSKSEEFLPIYREHKINQKIPFLTGSLHDPKRYTNFYHKLGEIGENEVVKPKSRTIDMSQIKLNPQRVRKINMLNELKTSNIMRLFGTYLSEKGKRIPYFID